jgi:hypothetical protein
MNQLTHHGADDKLRRFASNGETTAKLYSASSDYSALGMLNWVPITAKLLAILREPAL